jgi:uncharacterized protein
MTNVDKRTRPSMEIRISGLSDGEYPVEFEVTPQQIGLEDFVGTVRLSGTLRKSSHQFFLNGTVSGTMHRLCDRCLAEVERRITVPINIYYIVEGDLDDADSDGGEVEVRSIHAEQHSIIVDEDVRQTLTIEVPIKILCKETCRGLCPNCGADLNEGDCACDTQEIDPRWGKLADLFKDKDSEDADSK